MMNINEDDEHKRWLEMMDGEPASVIAIHILIGLVHSLFDIVIEACGGYWFLGYM